MDLSRSLRLLPSEIFLQDTKVPHSQNSINGILQISLLEIVFKSIAIFFHISLEENKVKTYNKVNPRIVLTKTFRKMKNAFNSKWATQWTWNVIFHQFRVPLQGCCDSLCSIKINALGHSNENDRYPETASNRQIGVGLEQDLQVRILNFKHKAVTATGKGKGLNTQV